MNAENNQTEQSAGRKSQPHKPWRSLVKMVSGYCARHHAKQEQREKNEAAIVRWTKWTALGTWGAAVVAAVAAGLLLVQLADSREASIDANRAWIAPLGEHLDLVPDLANPGEAYYRVEVAYANIGHSPALHLTAAQYSFAFMPGPGKTQVSFVQVPDNTTCDRIDAGDLGVVFPNNPHEARAHPEPYKPFDGRIRSNYRLLVVQGCFKYSTFGQTRKTGYCFILVPHPATRSLAWAACGGGSKENFAD